MFLPPLVCLGFGGWVCQQLLGRDKQAEEEVGKVRPVSREDSHPIPLWGPARPWRTDRALWVPSHPTGHVWARAFSSAAFDHLLNADLSKA